METYNTKNLIDSAFIDFDGNVKSNPTCFTYEQILFKNYKHKIINGEDYLIGENAYNYLNGKIVTESDFTEKDLIMSKMKLKSILTPKVVCKDAEILISLLELWNELFVLNFDVKNSICRQHIIKWCKKYGLPFLGGDKTDISSDELNDRKFIKTDNGAGFSIAAFIKMLQSLYELFIFYLSYRDKKLLLPYENFYIEDCRNILYGEFASLRPYLYFDFDSMRLTTQFYNLFHVALYELMIMATINGNLEKQLGICACCGRAYEKTRRNQIYCKNCSPQKAYKRRLSKLNKEKMGAEK